VFHAQLDVNPALPQLTVVDVLSHSSFKEPSVKPAVMMDLLLLDQSAKDAQLDAYNALKTSSASTVLMASTCTTEPATAFALLEPLEIAHQVTGTVSHVTLPAWLAWIILHTAPAAKTARDTFKLQLLINPASKLAMMVPMLTTESAVSVTSSVQLVWEVLLTVFHALPIKSSIKEVAGPHAPLSS
jgi:hypothetical protein